MKRPTQRPLAGLLVGVAAGLPAAWALDKPRVLVLTDIENEPDGAMSLAHIGKTRNLDAKGWSIA